MKLYTKTGDSGFTSLIGGTRVKKNDARLECYGTIDELNSYIGLIRDVYGDELVKNQLLTIQNTLFRLGSDFADERDDKAQYIFEKDIDFLETAIDAFSSELPELHTFIIPGGHFVSSYCQIARSICRKLERNVYNLPQNVNFSDLSTIYINRLSDYLFVLARKVLKDFNKCEITVNSSL